MSETAPSSTGRRPILLEADTELLLGALKRVRARTPSTGTHTFFSDEPAPLGENSAPAPLLYFTSSIGF
jgi:hypothetical protein